MVKSKKHSLSSLDYEKGDMTLCLIGELSVDEMNSLEEDKLISEKQIFFFFDNIYISQKKMLVGVYANPEHWECIFDEFTDGVMSNTWSNKFQKFRN